MIVRLKEVAALLKTLVELAKPYKYVENLSPTLIGGMRSELLENENAVSGGVALGPVAFSEFTSNTEFSQFYDPTTEFNIVTQGYIGTLLGMGVYTDAFFSPNERVLAHKTVYVYSLNPKGEILEVLSCRINSTKEKTVEPGFVRVQIPIRINASGETEWSSSGNMFPLEDYTHILTADLEIPKAKIVNPRIEVKE